MNSIQDQYILGNLLKINRDEMKKDSENVIVLNDIVIGSQLNGIKGIGPSALKILTANDIKSVSDLCTASEAFLTDIIKNPLSLDYVLRYRAKQIEELTNIT